MTVEIKRKRGRPRKTEIVKNVVKRGRGRPRKASESEKPKNKVGRPKKDFSKPNKDVLLQQKEILLGLMAGRSLRSICKDKGMPHRDTVNVWCHEDKNFSVQYANARLIQADYYADMILDQTQILLNRAREGKTKAHEVSATSIYVDTRKWITARQAPKRYGKLAELINEDGEIEKISDIKITIENPVDLRKKTKVKKKK